MTQFFNLTIGELPASKMSIAIKPEAVSIRRGPTVFCSDPDCLRSHAHAGQFLRRDGSSLDEAGWEVFGCITKQMLLRHRDKMNLHPAHLAESVHHHHPLAALILPSSLLSTWTADVHP